MSKIPLVIYTAPPTEWCLPGLFFLLDTFTQDRLNENFDVYVYGFTETKKSNLPPDIQFVSMGAFARYPKDKWTDSFVFILDDLERRGIEAFMFLLEDYWPIRPIDVRAIDLLYNYMLQVGDVLKIDLARDRLYAYPERHFFDFHTAFTLGYLDIIEALPSDKYYVSLWGGLFSVQQLKPLVRKGLSAQNFEMRETLRVNKAAEDGNFVPRHLGTRQAPYLHDNIVHAGKAFEFGPLMVPKMLMETMYQMGLTKGVKDYDRGKWNG